MGATTHDLVVTSSPHVHAAESVPKIMHTVWLALLPASLAAVWIFGYQAAVVLVVSTVACVGFELLFLKLRRMPWAEARVTALDGSAIVTGVLLAMNLPPAAPWWMVLVGAFIAMSIGKHIFGGIGNNPFNPALVARVFLLISFPTQMLSWSPPVNDPTAPLVDVETYATPLGKLKEAAMAGESPEKLAAIMTQVESEYPVTKLFLGNVGGSLGEVSALALLLGAALLLFRRIITWHIPVAFIATTALVTLVPWLVAPEVYVDPLYHVFGGGLLLGALFMATDMVTSPVTAKGMLIFGAGCGLITAVIRLWGAYPEGVSFAILIMNGLVPLIDKYTKPRKFGEVRRAGA
jgi:electron transport complex protein RnfD